MSTDPLVTVIILNRNGRQHLEYCLPSILQTDYPNFNVILVDNDSSDDSRDYMRAHFPQIPVIETGRNAGWAGGNNVGIRYARQYGARYVVLANNDIKVHPQWIRSCVAAFQSDPCVAFAGCTVYGDIRAVPEEEFQKACREWKEIRTWITDDYIDGMALFIDVTVFDRIGMIDEGYFIYCEETDLETRARKAGFKRAKTNVPVWHYSRGYFRKMTLKAGFYAIRNNIRFALKNCSLLGIMRALAREYYVGCWPFYHGDMTKVTTLRSRPGHPLINFFLVTYCVLWNVIFLPRTMLRRFEDYRLVKTHLMSKAG